MVGRARRFLSVIAAVDTAREQHPEFREPLNAARLARAFRREQIDVLRRAISAKAYVQGADGSYVIIVSAALHGRNETRVLAHEYGHIRLHLGERGEVVRQLAPCRRGDPREYEAELFALLLRLGPAATPDHPDVARLVAKMEAASYRERAPEQLPLSLAERVPPLAIKSFAEFTAEERRDFEERRARAAARRRRGARPSLPGSSVGLGCSHDALLFDWSRAGKPLRYFHLVLGWLEVYDGMRVRATGGRSRWVLVKCGDRRAEQRLFVISATDRRRYVFADGEKRGRSPKELDAQLARASRTEADALPARPASGSILSPRGPA